MLTLISIFYMYSDPAAAVEPTRRGVLVGFGAMLAAGRTPVAFTPAAATPVGLPEALVTIPYRAQRLMEWPTLETVAKIMRERDAPEISLETMARRLSEADERVAAAHGVDPAEVRAILDLMHEIDVPSRALPPRSGQIIGDLAREYDRVSPELGESLRMLVTMVHGQMSYDDLVSGIGFAGTPHERWRRRAWSAHPTYQAAVRRQRAGGGEMHEQLLRLPALEAEVGAHFDLGLDHLAEEMHYILYSQSPRPREFPKTPGFRDEFISRLESVSSELARGLRTDVVPLPPKLLERTLGSIGGEGRRASERGVGEGIGHAPRLVRSIDSARAARLSSAALENQMSEVAESMARLTHQTKCALQLRPLIEAELAPVESARVNFRSLPLNIGLEPALVPITEKEPAEAERTDFEALPPPGAPNAI